MSTHQERSLFKHQTAAPTFHLIMTNTSDHFPPKDVPNSVKSEKSLLKKNLMREPMIGRYSWLSFFGAQKKSLGKNRNWCREVHFPLRRIGKRPVFCMDLK